MKRGLKILLFCFTSLSLISWDQATKEIARQHLKDNPPVSLLHHTVQLMYVENTGAAMSLGDHLTKTTGFWLLTILPLVALLAAFIYVIRKSGEMKFSTLLICSLIISGGIGNIIDRALFHRHVTDFMIISFGKVHTGVFNFADMCITAGVIFLLILLPFKREPVNSGLN